MVLILAGYAINPSKSNPIRYMLFLSYPLPADDPLIPYYADSLPDRPTFYGKGPLDFAFVGFYVIVLSFTREFLMQRLIRPWAIASGIRNRSKQNRFMEQVYTAMYFIILGPLGLYVMSRTPVWYFNTTGMFEGFPHRAHEGLFKAYYLLQASYWAQQFIVLVLRLEKPRKDFKELVGHHIVTLALIWLSYRFHFTYMGLAVYITHDISDFFLAVWTLDMLSLIESGLISIDLKNPKLSRLLPHLPLLHCLHWHLGLSPPLHQSSHPLRDSHHFPNGRPLQTGLGYATV